MNLIPSNTIDFVLDVYTRYHVVGYFWNRFLFFFTITYFFFSRIYLQTYNGIFRIEAVFICSKILVQQLKSNSTISCVMPIDFLPFRWYFLLFIGRCHRYVPLIHIVLPWSLFTHASLQSANNRILFTYYNRILMQNVKNNIIFSHQRHEF